MLSTAVPLLFIPSLGVGELAIIFAIILLLFGPSKLPQAAKALGDSVRQFKDSINPTPAEKDKPAPPDQSDTP